MADPRPAPAEQTYADALNQALAEEMARDDRVYLIGEDIGAGVPFGVTKGLREVFGAGRVLDAPISEAVIVGSAVGAAMTGMRPVVDMHFADFVTCAMDEVVNQLAKSRYMFGGQCRFPLTLRMPYGIGKSAGGHHSNSVEAWFLATPGLKLCLPSTPADAKGLLKTAIRDDDPVLVFEQRSLYRVTGPVPEGEHLVPLGVAEVKRPGRDATVIATARMVHLALEAAEALAGEGIDVEVVDPRSLVPLDRDTLVASVARTHHLVIVEEGPLRGGVGGHLAWVVSEAAFDELDAPIERVAGADVPVPFAPVLEAAVSPQVPAIAAAVRRTLGLGP
jgi:pyruvate dehydrogenase E1 component beta subunit